MILKIKEYRFPCDEDRRSLWAKAVNRSNQTCSLTLWSPKTSDRLCSKHFTANDYLDGNSKKLKSSSVPSIFPHKKVIVTRELPNKLEKLREMAASEEKNKEESLKNLLEVIIHRKGLFQR